MHPEVRIPHPLNFEESCDFIKKELRTCNGEAYPCRLRFQLSEAPISMYAIREEGGVGWALREIVGSAMMYWRDTENPPPIFLDVSEE